MEKKVSVIIPTYKRSKYLKRAINSVLCQNYNNFEVIVVDDNNSDTYDRKCNQKLMKKYKKYGDKIKFIMHEQNKNGAAARNTGISVSCGDYITFLDDDDIFLPDRLEKCVEYLENNSRYECVYTGCAIFKNNKLINVLHPNLYGNQMQNILMQNSFIGTGSNMFFSRKAIKKVGNFDENFFRHQDLEYLVRFFTYYEIGYIDDVLVAKFKEDSINSPNFNKGLLAKKMYLDRFKNEIQTFDKKIQDIIYFNNFKILLDTSCSTFNDYNELSKYIQLKKPITVYIIMNTIKKNKFLKYMVYSMKEFRYLSMKKNINKYIKKIEAF